MTSQNGRRQASAIVTAMFAPVIVYFIVFKYVPMAGLIIAFKQYTFADGIWGSPWVGLDHFRFLFQNPQTVKIILNTLLLSLLNIFVGFPFPIVLAILLNEIRLRWFQRSVQTLVYIPRFLSCVIIGGIVVQIFSQQNGIVNAVFDVLGMERYPFLYKEGSWIAIFVASGIWQSAGFSAIIYLAALSTIDPGLYESASLDGAGKLRKIWHVTLPGISTVIVLMLILRMGHVMEVGFDQVYMLQNQAVSAVSEVISTYVYKMGIQKAQFSLTSALGLFESVIGLILVVTANRIAKKFEKSLW